MGSVKNKKSRHSDPEDILFGDDAIRRARDAVEEISDDGGVGEYLGASAVDDVVLHRFRCQAAGYSGWEWIAVLASVPGSGFITVNEVTVQAGSRAMLAPQWVPYEDRVLPGDLRPGDCLPPRVDDVRLSAHEDVVEDDGFPRNPQASRALSAVGLREALQRWRSAFGAASEFAVQASMMCRTCAFFLPMQGENLGFGVCANEFSADGHVVHIRYGCGAHSETKEAVEPGSSREYGAFDDEGFGLRDFS